MSSKKQRPPAELSREQAQALEILQSGENVFLTGGAGSGKSFLIREFRSGLDPKSMPLLASTGAAAVLLDGRTFHSFFGLGILEGGVDATRNRCLNNPKLMTRLRAIDGFIIDEISMIPGQAFALAEELCREARSSNLVWGGLRAIVVGDFAQLPPVTRGTQRDWCFLSPVWDKSGFINVVLRENQRVLDADFIEVLNDIREGNLSERAKSFLDHHVREHDDWDKSPRLFSRRDHVEKFNQGELAQLPGEDLVFDSIYFGSDRGVEQLKKSGPVPGRLVLREGAQVLFIQNDPNKRWVNGSRGTVVGVETDDTGLERIAIEKENFRHVTVDRVQFSLLDGDGQHVASVVQYPLILGYATTIHKSQGATMDEMWVNLSNLWEPGQAYVALSRLRTGQGLRLLGWHPRSFLVDPQVIHFYNSLE
ncbi:MAG: AAA family ATPase [Bdellovibrionaceae bacterium]|nr:AAA family ATPase [Pseudobdellovibrionaceae bacterium]